VELETKLLQEVIKIEEEYNMQMVTIWEREAKKEGKKEGKKIGEKIGERRGLEMGERRGLEIGEEKARIETARELVRYGVDIDIISKATGLSRDEIEKLVEVVQ
jgi:predicted transposase/invertase (TIGR01784 family)